MEHTRRLATLGLGIAVLTGALPGGSVGAAAEPPAQLVGRWGYGPSKAVASAGSLALVGMGAQLVVVDVSTPASPLQVGSVPLGGLIRGITVSDTVALVAAGKAGLRVVDFSDATRPVEVGAVDTPGDARRVVLDGTTAYVADGTGGLRIIDMSDPARPVEIGALGAPLDARGVAITGTVALVADSTGKLHVLDVADVAQPVEVAQLSVGAGPSDVAVSGTFAYVSSGRNSLVVVDIADASAPVVVATTSHGFWVTDVRVSGENVFAWGDYWGSLVDVTDPLSPKQLGLFHSGADVAPAATLVLVAGDDAALRLVDISTPSKPVDVASLPARRPTGAVDVYGGFAFLVDGEGIRILDIADPASPTEVGFKATSPWSRGVAASGSYAYVAAGAGGLRVMNVSDPTSPRIVGSSSAFDATDVAVSGDLVFVTDSYWDTFALESSLLVLRVTTPSRPERLGRVYIPEYASAAGVTAVGGVAYMTEKGTGLHIVDSDSWAIDLVSLEGEPQDVAVSGANAFVASGSSGLFVVDVSTPSVAHAIASVGMDRNAVGVAVAGPMALVANSEDGLRIIDATVPSAPIDLGSVATPGRAVGITAVGNLAFVADRDAGLSIFGVAGAPGCTLPTIVTQPASQLVSSGKGGLLNVSATGDGPLAYQWYRGSSGDVSQPQPGAWSRDFKTPASSGSQSYWVRVSNRCGRSDSTSANITTRRPSRRLGPGTP